MTQDTDTLESIAGIVERIVFHNPKNGFAVLRMTAKGHKDTVTVVCNIPSISVGERVQCSGLWHLDRTYGRQFKASLIKLLPPDTLEGIEKYLASGLIKGIGIHFAKKLVDTFGNTVFEVIEQKPELLSTIDGIGTVRAKQICASLQDQKIIRDIMIFLQSHGISTTRATRIYKTYGAAAIEIVSSNPYRLAKDIKGIGFLSADVIATNLGIAKDSMIRIIAALTHLLLEASINGHCYLPRELLIQNTEKLLGVDTDLIKTALKSEIASNTLTEDNTDNATNIFLTNYYIHEQSIAKILLKLANSTPWELNASQDIQNKYLSQSQKDALVLALTTKVLVITGGPGTGKTTLINEILLTISQKLHVKLCAPTGRAAKRLNESTNLDATTIHRLLGTDSNGGFKHNEHSKLSCDYLIIDEVSMVDVVLFSSLLKALPDHCGLLLVGDVDQLPSVGAGQVLCDIINSGVIKTVKLTEIFRQVATSKIINNAHLVNKGIVPNLQATKEDSDFYFIEAMQGDDITLKIIDLVQNRIPEKFDLHPVNDIQVLCPMQKGGAGVRSLNIELQQVLNPNCNGGIAKFDQIFAIGDKIMQTENNYDKEVYNGDIGIIRNVDQQEREMIISFDNRNVIYDYTDLDQITLAYAITIHKSQGSEYPAVIIPLTMQSFMMLKRNLIYTAITRGKKLVVIIGEKKALAIGVKNDKNQARYSQLKEWLRVLSQ